MPDATQSYPEPTVGGLIFAPDGRLFLMRSHKWRGKYVIPGGHVELGETLEAALRREVAEETGLTIHDIAFVCMQEFIYDPAYWQPRHFLFFDFVCHAGTTDARLNDEAEDYTWVTVDEAFSLPTEPYTLAAIRAYLAQRAGSPASPLRYVHTNLIAADWRALARFYETVFGCVRVPPERDLSGPSLEAGTSLPGAHLTGAHLRLPGYGEAGPTLEIFTYDDLEERPATAVNRPGFGHLAFSVADVAASRAAVLAAGGRAIGEVVTVAVTGGDRVTWCYLTDPEGNVLELQTWAR